MRRKASHALQFSTMWDMSVSFRCSKTVRHGLSPNWTPAVSNYATAQLWFA